MSITVYDPDVPLEKQLKPCPFCGELPANYHDDGALMVYCDNIDCIMFDLQAVGWRAWEKRASDE